MKHTTTTLACLLLCAAATAFGQEAAKPAEAAAAAAATNAPPTSPPWDASAAFGLSLTKGNSDTLLFNLDIIAAKKWGEGLRNEFRTGFNGNYGENEGTKNAESARAYAQYNRLFTEKLFGYMRVEGLYDAIAAIDYRFTISPGLGYYLIKDAKTTLSFEAGPGYIIEREGVVTLPDGTTTGGERNDYFTLRFAERFDYKLNDKAKIWQLIEYLPQVDDWGNYIINGEVGIETAITKHFSQRTFLQDTYHSRPTPGRKDNDIKLVAGIAYKL